MKILSAGSPLRSYLLSLVLTVQSVIVTMVTVGFGLGLCNTWESTLTYLATNWWGGLLGAILGVGPYYRAHKASVRESVSTAVEQTKQIEYTKLTPPILFPDASPTPIPPPTPTGEIKSMATFTGSLADALVKVIQQNQPAITAALNTGSMDLEAFIAQELSLVKPTNGLLAVVWSAVEPALVAELKALEATAPGSVAYAFLLVEAQKFATSLGG